MWNSPSNSFLMLSCSWQSSEGEKAPGLVGDLELISKGHYRVLSVKKLKVAFMPSILGGETPRYNAMQSCSKLLSVLVG